MKSISALKDAGHTYSAIAEKTGLELTYVKGIARLLNTSVRVEWVVYVVQWFTTITE